MNLTGEKILIGLSGGINSMAVLCWLIETGEKPLEVHLFYAHFKEHSPDTFKFFADGVRYARQNFETVKVQVTRNSIIEFFKAENIIPHPASSPCSKRLKIEPINNYAFENGIKIDLVGYVKHELKRRVNRQQKNLKPGLFSLDKYYVIGQFTDEWCFEIVDRHIGWHPALYDIKDETGKRIFAHNNCLPCKNMTIDQMEAVRTHYPLNHLNAMQLSKQLKKYWGRSEADFYTTFGRELGQDSSCDFCKW